MGIREWRRHQGIPKGALTMVSPGSMYALSSTTPLKYFMQLDPTHQHHFSLFPLSFMTKNSSQNPNLNLTPIKKSRKGSLITLQ